MQKAEAERLHKEADLQKQIVLYEKSKITEQLEQRVLEEAATKKRLEAIIEKQNFELSQKDEGLRMLRTRIESFEKEDISQRKSSSFNSEEDGTILEQKLEDDTWTPPPKKVSQWSDEGDCS